MTEARGIHPAADAVTRAFGYCPAPIDLKTDRFSIQTLPTHADLVAEVTDNPGVYKDWIYAGPQAQLDFGSGRTRQMPYSARVFSLPKTHLLTLRRLEAPWALDFIVWILSFFTGMRLTTTEAGFLDATPIKPGKLVDFVLRRRNLADAVDLGLDYLQSERDDPRSPERISAAIHALFLAQHPRHLPFETFQYLYMALDACYSLAAAKEPANPKIPHAKRIQWMCERFGLSTPAWAVGTATEAAHLSIVRNEAFHEGLFFGEPLGFAIYGGSHHAGDADNVTLQMQALVCRLLVAVLGRPEATYVKTPVDTRSHHALELRG